jgi:hypothetical protein
VPFAGDLGLVNGGGWSFAHLFQRSFQNADGALRYDLPNGLFYATAAFRSNYLTPLVAPFLVLGLVWAARFPRCLILLGGWPVALLLLDAGLAEQNPRFVLAALPPLAVFAGLGAAVLWTRTAVASQGSSQGGPEAQRAPRPVPTEPARTGARRRSWIQLERVWHPFLAVIYGACIISVAVSGLGDVAALNAARVGDREVAAWASARVPAHATTVAFGITLTLDHVTRLHPLDLSELTPAQLRSLSAQSPTFLLVQVRAMTGQVAQRTPGLNYRFLRDRLGLIRLGALHGYTLFRVRAA